MKTSKGSAFKKPKVCPVPRSTVYNYYAKRFPWKELEKFATCNGRYALSRRVFWCFRYGNIATDRMVFETIDALKYYVLSGDVMTIHIGAILPLERAGMAVLEAHASAGGGGVGLKEVNKILAHVNTVPYSKCLIHDQLKKFLERELVVDIDLNDYGDLRNAVCNCQNQKMCCDKCWEVFIARTAIPVIRYLFQDFFGFKEVTWVYSGRRGIHVHVQDPRAMRMTADERRITIYENLIMGTGGCNPEVRHHLLETIYRPVYNTFIAPSRGAAESDDKIIEYLRPRLDDCFWRGDLGHQVKCPFTLHLVTGNVCRPLTEDFTPSKAIRADLIL